MDKAWITRRKYHPETGVELGSSEILDDDGFFKSLLEEKEIALGSNILLREKLRELKQENKNLLRKLERLSAQKQSYEKTKAISDRFFQGHKKFKAIKRLIKARDTNQCYKGFEKDIGFFEK